LICKDGLFLLFSASSLVSFFGLVSLLDARSTCSPPGDEQCDGGCVVLGNVNAQEAQYLLGKCYYTGQGLPRDDSGATLWLRRAAEGGHAESAFLIWRILNSRGGGRGGGEDRDDVEALERAADLGMLPQCMTNHGTNCTSERRDSSKRCFSSSPFVLTGQAPWCV